MAVKHLFFDLDHTIWDFNENARQCLHMLYKQYNLAAQGIADCESFISFYLKNNHMLWAAYQAGNIDKETLRQQRFTLTFNQAGLAEVPEGFSEAYVKYCPLGTHLFKGSSQVLNALACNYQLHIITNGFKDSVALKLRAEGIAKLFTHIIVSETVGCHKPDVRIFKYAMEQAAAAASESLMIGDNFEADIAGALKAGMQAIYFNTDGQHVPAGSVKQFNNWYALEKLLF